MSVVGSLQAARNEIDLTMEGPEIDLLDSSGAAREFALAKTAIEDAIMRTNRGFAKRQGIFKEADVQLEVGHSSPS